jgi:hypothetical protein
VTDCTEPHPAQVVTDCTEPHPAQASYGIAREGQKGTPKEAQS